MIPNTTLFTTDITTLNKPSKDHMLDISHEIINGTIDGIESMQQVIYKILNTERYRYLIYSWDYGVELSDLYGEPITYVVPELERRITEALLQDDRINSVGNFEFDISSKGKVHTTFSVETVFGSIDSELEVEI